MPLRGQCASAHRRSGYSSSSCVPAEPDSASPDISIVGNPTVFAIPTLDTFRGRYQRAQAGEHTTIFATFSLAQVSTPSTPFKFSDAFVFPDLRKGTVK